VADESTPREESPESQGAPKTTSSDRGERAPARQAETSAKRKKPRQKDVPATKPLSHTGNLWMSRRDFSSKAGWVAFFTFIATFLLGSLRYMFPRVLFEPSPRFKAGFPEDYPVGDVSTKWVKDYRVWIIREETGFYALLAICTHLGCTPRWLAAENKFKCPCHGSGFTKEGINFEGPAPRPLERVAISLAEDGQVLIDKSLRFREEKGDWANPSSYLEYST
jgi:cytochrome b6-f complex iron-sulfur subunit